MMRKRIVASVLYIILLILMVIVLPNSDSIKNIMADNKESVYLAEDCSFVNWEVNGDGSYTSLEDSQIYVLLDGSYVNNVIIKSDTNLAGEQMKIFYTLAAGDEYTEDKCISVKPIETTKGFKVTINKAVYSLRIDITEEKGYKCDIDSIIINPRAFEIVWVNMVPFLAALVFLCIIRKRMYILRDVYQQRSLIVEMAKNDLKSRYAGSIFGILWAYVQPILTIIVMWYVFQIGFRNPPVENIEYILWFIAGYIPWMFFNDGLVNITNSIHEYSYLVKKIKFKVSILPAIKLASSFCIHFFFVMFVFVMYIIYGHVPQIIWLQAFYYSFSLMVLLFGLGLIFSSLAVLFKDCAQVVSVVLQVLFWYTPIVWVDTNVSGGALTAFKINPLYYIISGYRETFIDGIGCWEHPAMNAYFWGVTFVILTIGFILFDRFKAHFSDLL